MKPKNAVATALFLCLTTSLASATDTTTTFEAGAEGWVGPSGIGGATTIEPTGGNPDGNMRTVFNDFGITFDNTSNPGFVGDYTATPSVTLSIDTQVSLIEFFGSPVPRPWLVELRDYDDPEPGFPYTSVWYKFADIASATHSSWTTFSVTIDDTSATALPAGWGGTGAESMLGEPMLPAGRTFTDVLAGVDEIAFTTLEPGFFFGFTDFDVRIDNIQRSGPSSVPLMGTREPLVLALLMLGAGAWLLRPRAATRT